MCLKRFHDRRTFSTFKLIVSYNNYVVVADSCLKVRYPYIRPRYIIGFFPLKRPKYFKRIKKTSKRKTRGTNRLSCKRMKVIDGTDRGNSCACSERAREEIKLSDCSDRAKTCLACDTKTNWWREKESLRKWKRDESTCAAIQIASHCVKSICDKVSRHFLSAHPKPYRRMYTTFILYFSTVLPLVKRKFIVQCYCIA